MAIVTETVGLSLVAAMDRRGGIGRGNDLLFRLKADLAHFRAVTKGKPVVMGRKTWDSLPKRPLPGRPNLIVTRNLQLMAPDAFVYASPEAAFAAARTMAAAMGVGEAAVIGGGELYAAALPSATRIWLTEIDAEADADTWFPKFDRSEWREASSTHHASQGEEPAFTVREFVRA